MADRIQLRQDTGANWTSNDPILAQGEFGLETDTGFLKLGDGSSVWTSLAYLSPPPEFRDESSTTYTLVMADGKKVIRFTGASPAVTIPQEASVDYPLNTVLTLRQAGTGTLTLTTTGLTINGTVPSWAQHVEVQFRKVAADTWDVI